MGNFIDRLEKFVQCRSDEQIIKDWNKNIGLSLDTILQIKKNKYNI